MIPTEDNYVDWILSGIRHYFDTIGYAVHTYSIGQVKEGKCPVDRILAVHNKIVGLQFKRPTTTERPWKWELKPRQHRNISESKWIFYCLPDFADLRLKDVALYHCRFQRGYVDENMSVSFNERARYYRWGAFANALLACREGLHIGDERQIDQLITDMYENPRDTYLLLNKIAEEVFVIRGRRFPGERDHGPA